MSYFVDCCAIWTLRFAHQPKHESPILHILCKEMFVQILLYFDINKRSLLIQNEQQEFPHDSTGPFLMPVLFHTLSRLSKHFCYLNLQNKSFRFPCQYIVCLLMLILHKLQTFTCYVEPAFFWEQKQIIHRFW